MNYKKFVQFNSLVTFLKCYNQVINSYKNLSKLTSIYNIVIKILVKYSKLKKF